MPYTILSGVRILDFTHFLAGPSVTNLMAELGAEVVKVESVQHFDGGRNLNFIPGDASHERSAGYNHFNRNKLGVTLNLSDAWGRALALQLASISDAIVENFPAGVMDRLGFTEPALRQANPTVVWLSMPGYGLRGSWSHFPSFATSLAMMGGLYEITGEEGQEPTTPCVSGVDPINGILGANALLMALLLRRRRGEGVHLDFSHLESTTTLIGELIADYSVNGRVATRRGNTHPYAAPHGVYPSAGDDAWVAVAAYDDAQFAGLCLALGLPDLAADPRFASAPERLRHTSQLDEMIAAWTRQRTPEEAMRELQAQGVPAGVVHSSRTVLADPHLSARGAFEPVERELVGVRQYVRPPFHFSSVSRTPARPAPLLGQHNQEVLGGLLGLPAEEMAALTQAHVIGTAPLTKAV